ncbi:single-stranded DNA-binding protein [Mycolicibacterium palauense]|uniref:single-stranded DNA-binding protein n=1 Tax=Mycolicibacterium palauense TaxID=2034511 RepID=UPI000BFF0CD1|nr:single-stranded DNA-binding protein [Mycolicibacterium palauense]
MSLPEVTIKDGTLTADPELRFTQGGKAVASMNIANNSRRKNQQTGQWEDGDATFLRCSIWGDYAEHVAETLTKGSKVIGTGVLKQRSYEKDGQNRTVLEVELYEIGPSLRFATARIDRGQSSGSTQAADPWGSNDTPDW